MMFDYCKVSSVGIQKLNTVMDINNFGISHNKCKYSNIPKLNYGYEKYMMNNFGYPYLFCYITKY